MCFRTNRGKILPKLINPESTKLLEIAEELLAVFSGSVGAVREKLEEATKQVLDGFPGNAVVGRGLEKLLLDRTEFDTEVKTELADLRQKVFFHSSALLKGKGEISLRGFEEGVAGDLKNFQSEIAHEIGISAADLGRQLYGDLPPFQQVLPAVCKSRTISAGADKSNRVLIQCPSWLGSSFKLVMRFQFQQFCWLVCMLL